MERSCTVKYLRSIAVASAALLAAGCAAHKPVAEMARAEQAVEHAETSSEADRLAPVELSAAQSKLAVAERAMADHDYVTARRLAEEARADAELAESKADSQMAREQAARTRQDIETLQTEVESPSTVVVERRTVQSTVPSTVVVEHRTVQSPPPTTVIFERPSPTDEKAVVAPLPAPAVEVVPER
jgi:hypothetical protein